MFITYKQTSEQSYLIDYGNDINIITNKKVISHFKYIIKNNFYFINNVVPSFNKILIQFDPNYKSTLKKEKLTTRDSRSVERKKYGHRKARRSFQFSKR